MAAARIVNFENGEESFCPLEMQHCTIRYNEAW